MEVDMKLLSANVWNEELSDSIDSAPLISWIGYNYGFNRISRYRTLDDEVLAGYRWNGLSAWRAFPALFSATHSYSPPSSALTEEMLTWLMTSPNTVTYCPIISLEPRNSGNIQKREIVHPAEIRTSISPSSAVELNTTSALANHATEAGNALTTALFRSLPVIWVILLSYFKAKSVMDVWYVHRLSCRMDVHLQGGADTQLHLQHLAPLLVAGIAEIGASIRLLHARDDQRTVTNQEVVHLLDWRLVRVLAIEPSEIRR
uniref:Uncharacterized protein n=1 Tax=Timema douglasi TaxID=61478 RepID=A0A7R8VTS6_TIMDO|nr:unnamed protein product [Timema douglasi]